MRMANSTRFAPSMCTFAAYWPGGKRLAQKRAQAHLAPGAAQGHVGKHAAQVLHARGQGVHLAQPAVYALELLRNGAEGFAQPRFQRGLQARIHALAHLLHLALERQAQFFLVFPRGLAGARELRRRVAQRLGKQRKRLVGLGVIAPGLRGERAQGAAHAAGKPPQQQRQRGQQHPRAR